MAKFNSNKLLIDNINSGNKFNNGDGLPAEVLNYIIEGVLYNNENSGSGSGSNVDLSLYQAKLYKHLITIRSNGVGVQGYMSSPQTSNLTFEKLSTRDTAYSIEDINSSLFEGLSFVMVGPINVYSGDYHPLLSCKVDNTYSEYNNILTLETPSIELNPLDFHLDTKSYTITLLDIVTEL